jgi:hypothetical protein
VRIEYNLHTALISGMLSENGMQIIIDDLHYEKEKWFFTNEKIAKKFANLSLHFTKYIWASDWNVVIQYFFSEAMNRAKKLDLINLDDIHFGSDREVLDKILNSNDKKIKELLYKCKYVDLFFESVDDDDCDWQHFTKFRGIDPMIRKNNELILLSSIDEEFKKEYHTLEKLIEKGLRVRFNKIKPNIIS